MSRDVCTPVPVAALAHQHSGPTVSVSSGAACSLELHGLAYLAGETAKGLDLEPLFQGGCPIQGWALGLYAQTDKWKLEMRSARLAWICSADPGWIHSSNLPHTTGTKLIPWDAHCPQKQCELGQDRVSAWGLWSCGNREQLWCCPQLVPTAEPLQHCLHECSLSIVTPGQFSIVKTLE